MPRQAPSSFRNFGWWMIAASCRDSFSSRAAIALVSVIVILRLKVTVPCSASSVKVRSSASARPASVCLVAEIAASSRLTGSGATCCRAVAWVAVDMSRISVIGGGGRLRLQGELVGELLEIRVALQNSLEQRLEPGRAVRLAEQVAQPVACLEQ